MGDRMTCRSTERLTIPSERGPGVLAPKGLRLPTFIVIGAMKAGTTSLFEYLRAHPQIFMPQVKEMDFFVEELNWRRGIEWYGRQFRRLDPHVTAIGEASPSYAKYPEYAGVPERIASCAPDAQLIYVVRDPIERIRSHYQHRAMTGSEHDPIERAVLRDPTYIDTSRYAMQIERYLHWFPREHLLLLSSEELRSDRVTTLRRVLEFLRVDPRFVPPTIDREFYRTEERARYPRYVWWVRRNLKRFVPHSKRWWLRRTMNRYVQPPVQAKDPAEKVAGSPPGPTVPHQERTEAKVTVSEQLRERLADLLREDVTRLRTYMSEGFDGWGIA